jgi:hypothetical protein
VTLAVISRGQTETGHGSGFQPGETVTGTQQSTPLDLGTQVADADGNVTFSWTIRADETFGTHTFTITGAESGTASATFRVVDGSLPPTGNEISSMLARALFALVIGVVLVAATMQLRGATKR